MPRDVILFAAGAVLTALAVKYADMPWLWNGTIYVGSFVMAYAAVDFFWKRVRHDVVIWGFVVVGIFGCAGWYFWPQSRIEAHSTVAQAKENGCGPISAEAPSWLRIAATQCGQHELVYPQENPRINEYYQTLRDGKNYRQDAEDPTQDWASPFVEWSLEKAGKIGPRQIEPLAWLSWGRKIAKPEIGCIVVLRIGGEHRKIGGALTGGLHHVGFYAGDAPGDRIYVLGGNEEDQVKIADYAKSDVVGYRMPR